MISLVAHDLLDLATAAETAYPNEACALLEGTVAEHGIIVSRIHLAQNVAVAPATHFEVDPRLILRLHRELRDGPTRVVGVWHSHTNGRAQPSATDLAMAFEPSLIWVITPIRNGVAKAAAAFQLRERPTFAPVQVVTHA